MSDRNIKRPDCLQNGPSDGVMMTADCIRTDFLENTTGGEQIFQQMDKSSSHISASVQIGIFSIRDMASNVMLTVSLEDAMAVMKEAIDLSKGS